MNMEIRITAEIVIVINGMQTKNTKGRQTRLPIKGVSRPSKAGKTPSGTKVAKTHAKPANGPKTPRSTRSDKGGLHKSSCCGTLGRRATRRLKGYCKACYPPSGWL